MTSLSAMRLPTTGPISTFIKPTPTISDFTTTCLHLLLLVRLFKKGQRLGLLQERGCNINTGVLTSAHSMRQLLCDGISLSGQY